MSSHRLRHRQGPLSTGPTLLDGSRPFCYIEKVLTFYALRGRGLKQGFSSEQIKQCFFPWTLWSGGFLTKGICHHRVASRPQASDLMLPPSGGGTAGSRYVRNSFLPLSRVARRPPAGCGRLSQRQIYEFLLYYQSDPGRATAVKPIEFRVLRPFGCNQFCGQFSLFRRRIVTLTSLPARSRCGLVPGRPIAPPSGAPQRIANRHRIT